MGFVKDAANVATFGLLGSQLLKNKKKPPVITPQPSMISNIPIERPTSMIGPSRGGY